MYFSRLALPALLAGATSASPLLAERTKPQCSFSLDKSLSDETLYAGVAAPAIAGVQAATQLGIHASSFAASGEVTVDVTDKFLINPTIRVGLGGVKAYAELDLSASASVQESIELVSSEKLTLAIPGVAEVDAGAAFALDLVLGISAAVDVSAGFYVLFPEDAYVEISLLTKEIVSSALEGVTAQSLPIAVGAEVDLEAEITLSVGLRLRAEVGLAAGIDILGLELGAGADVAVWISLFDYTSVIVATSTCPCSLAEKFYVHAGIAIELDVDIADCFDLKLAPTVSVTLSSAVIAEICLPDRGHGSGSGSGSGHHGTGPGSESSSAITASAAPTSSGSDLVTSTITTTQTYTITSCAASVVNCPHTLTQKVVTSTVIVKTTVCPATESALPTTSSCSVPSPTAAPTSLTPCPTPTSSTFTPPASCPTPAPTVTIIDTTTVCLETLSTSTKSKAPESTTTTCTETSTGYPLPSKNPGGPISSTTVVVVGTGGYTHQPKPTGGASGATGPCPGCVTAGASGLSAGVFAAMLVPAVLAALM